MSWSSAQIQRERSASAGILDSDLRDASASEGFDDTVTDGEDHPELGIGFVSGHENQVDAMDEWQEVQLKTRFISPP